jgi:hypothetical protein
MAALVPAAGVVSIINTGGGGGGGSFVVIHPRPGHVVYKYSYKRPSHKTLVYQLVFGELAVENSWINQIWLVFTLKNANDKPYPYFPTRREKCGSLFSREWIVGGEWMHVSYTRWGVHRPFHTCIIMRAPGTTSPQMWIF